MAKSSLHQRGPQKRNRNGQIKISQRQTIPPNAELPSINPRRPSKSNVKTTNPARLVFKPQSEWHAASLPALPESTDMAPPIERSVMDRVRQYAISLLEADNNNYPSSHHASSSSSQFYSTIMTSGTLSDKVSALTLVVQESPVHNTKALEALLSLARKRSRGQAVDVLKALKDLMAQGAVLPPHRKLRPFMQQLALLEALHASNTDWKQGQPLPGSIQKVHLIYWAYEDWLKTFYFEMLKVFEIWCNDGVGFARARATAYVWELLKDKSEQESNLLRLLVNKLGDRDKKIASKVSFLLLQLENVHPLMKSTIISAVESELLFRPGQHSHARYYAVITLNQTVLSANEGGIAGKLLEVYFSVFVSLLKRPEKTKTASTGPNAVKLNRKGQVQGGGGPAGKQSRHKDTLKQSSQDLDDELREKMISAVLTGVNRAIPFATIDPETYKQHLDTLFKITHCSNFNTSIQALTLIQQLAPLHSQCTGRFYRTLYESLLDPRLLTSSKHAMLLNLVFKALSSDTNQRRVVAFIKRLLQIAGLHQPPFVSGVLYLVHELRRISVSLTTLLDRPEEHEVQGDEVFRDVQDEDDEAKGIIHSANTLSDGVHHEMSSVYDGRKRDPEHSHADQSCLWELTPYLRHFHPSVTLYASSLMSNDSLPNKPDLSLHTLIHFLDRFVYRNAKSTATGPRGMSIMQPLAGGDTTHFLVSARYSGEGQVPVNSEAFIRREVKDIGADEAFFHDYFRRIGKANAAVERTDVAKGHDLATGSDNEYNEGDIWKALVTSRPQLEGDEQSDSGVDMDGMSSGSEAESVAGDDEEASGSQDDALSEAAVDSGTDLDLESDDEALVASDNEIPSDVDRTLRDRVLAREISEATAPHRKRPTKKRRRLKHLPTFASADSYAAMLSGDDDDG